MNEMRTITINGTTYKIDDQDAANAILCKMEGEAFTLTDATDRPLQGLTLYGSTTQNGTPTPDAPVAIESPGDSGTLTVTVDTQTLTVPTPNGLPGIPVTSGGNYTDSTGQQWVCDEVDFARGVYVQRVYKAVFDGSENWWVCDPDTTSVRTDFIYPKPKGVVANDTRFVFLFSHGIYDGSYSVLTTYSDGEPAALEFRNIQAKYGLDSYTEDTWKAYLQAQYKAGTPVTVLYILKTPVESAIDDATLAAYAALHTNFPNTTVTAVAEMALTYVADTKTYVDNHAGSGGSGTGADGGYYTPAVTQPDANTMAISFTPSDSSMPAVAAQSVVLPSGPQGESPQLVCETAFDDMGTYIGNKLCVVTDPSMPYMKDELCTIYNGTTYVPVLNDYTLSWYVNGFQIDNPGPVNIQGPQGEKGDTGYTPIKGVDYYTPAEITAFEASIRDKFVFSNGWNHNGIFRGKYLGTAVTAAQYAQIAAGTFEDLYIGDYWTINGVNYRIAHFDYYYQTGPISEYCTKHHVALVPDKPLLSSVMGTSGTYTSYASSIGATEGIPQANEIINSAFPNHVLTHYRFLNNSVDDTGVANGFAWSANRQAEIMTEAMVYGTNPWGLSALGGGSGYNVGLEWRQLALYALGFPVLPNRSVDNQKFWLRDVAGNRFSAVNESAMADCLFATTTCGVRPVFSIY